MDQNKIFIQDITIICTSHHSKTFSYLNFSLNSFQILINPISKFLWNFYTNFLHSEIECVELDWYAVCKMCTVHYFPTKKNLGSSRRFSTNLPRNLRNFREKTFLYLHQCFLTKIRCFSTNFCTTLSWNPRNFHDKILAWILHEINVIFMIKL